MSELVKQPSAKPTRKVAAMIIATFVVQGFLGVLEHYFPGISIALPAKEWIAAMVPVIAAYMTKDRAPA